MHRHPKKDDQKFDFVKDAMKDEGTKKNEGKCDETSWTSLHNNEITLNNNRIVPICSRYSTASLPAASGQRERTIAMAQSN